MSTIYYVGNAPEIAQVTDWLFGGTWEATDIITITPTGSTKTVSVTAGSTTITTIVDTIVTALNALSATTYPEFAEITWSRSSNSLRATSDTAGVAFSFTLATTETGGGTADAQTIDGTTSSAGTASTANSGPADVNVAANYSGGALPVNGDTLILRGDVDLLYNLGALSSVTLAELLLDPTYVGDVGLPIFNPGATGTSSQGYLEYRATEFAIGATLINIHSTGGRCNLNMGSVQTTGTVYGSGTPSDANTKAIQFRGTHASNAWRITRGSFAAAQYASQVATIATLHIGYQTSITNDADVYLGPGTTLTTINKTGGQLETNSAFTTLNHYAGQTVITTGAPGTINVFSGQVRDRSTGTTTMASVYDTGVYDLSQGTAAKTITNMTLYSGSEFSDPAERATFSNAVALKAPLSKIKLNIGTDFSLQRS